MVGRAEIGAAWAKTSKDGRVYLGLKLDDPSFTAPIYANLLDDENYSLTWSRPNGRRSDGASPLRPRLDRPASSFLGFMIGTNEVNVADLKRLRQLVKRDHGRISPTAFEAAEVLLTESRARFDFFLRQALLPTQAGKIPADQLAHIHAREDRGLHTLSLSTIVCN